MKILCSALYLSLVVSMAPGQSPAAPAGGKPAADQGSVEGMVVNSQSGEPIKKAQLTFADQSGASEAVRAVTDSGGKFKLTGIPPGSYRVVVFRTGFVRPQTRNEDASREPANLTLLPGQEIGGLVYRLVPAAILAGRVVDEDDAPLPGVRIQCLKPVYRRGGRQLASAGFATTDDRGQYRLAGLNPGRYYVRATYMDPTSLMGALRGGSAEGYAAVFYPGVIDAGQAAEVPVREGEERAGVDFKLSPAHVVHVQGQVRNPDGRLAGKEVGVFLSPRMSSGFGSRSSAAVGNDGSFRFEGVIPGAYLITAYPPLGGAATVRQELEVGETNLDSVRLVLKPRVDVKGRVRLEGDRKVSLQGSPVFLSPRDESVLLVGGTGMAAVGADGSFVFHGIADGEYVIEIDKLPEDCFLKTVSLGDRPVAGDALTVNEATAASSVDLLVSAGGGRVDGSLTDDQQKPAANVTVVLIPDAARRDRGELYRSVTTDQHGHFVMRGIPPGGYKLFAWSEELESGSWRDPAVLAPYEDQGKTLTIEESSRNTIELRTIHPVQ